MILAGVVDLLESARRACGRTVNAIMTATYWEVGRRIVEFEQGGAGRAEYGAGLIRQLSADLRTRFGRGFGVVNLAQMRRFFLAWPDSGIFQTPSEKSAITARHAIPATLSRKPGRASAGQDLILRPMASSGSPEGTVHQILQTPSEKSPESHLSIHAARFPLPWSHYVKLLSVESPEARRFYEAEALRGGWSVRQLDRQLSTLFYERTALSRNKAAMLETGGKSKPADTLSPEEEIKDPYVLEFLGLKDEYSESELEEALTRRLQSFLLELGGDFAFVGRKRRLRIGDEWYSLDLLFFHRRLRCLLVIDLKLNKFTHADAGQMHLYLNYARQHWTHPDENPPVGLILCARKDAAVARYALEGLPNKVLAAEYRMTLPNEALLAAEIDRTRAALERRKLAVLSRRNQSPDWKAKSKSKTRRGGTGRAGTRRSRRKRGKSR